MLSEKSQAKSVCSIYRKFYKMKLFSYDRSVFAWGVSGGYWKGGITERHEQMFFSDGYIHYLDCIDGLTNVYKICLEKVQPLFCSLILLNFIAVQVLFSAFSPILPPNPIQTHLPPLLPPSPLVLSMCHL